MKTIEPDSFALICFLALMQSGEGMMDKAPSYITEKVHMLKGGVNAFAHLDIYNGRKVRQWCETWGVEMPEPARKHLEAEEQAIKELIVRGFDIFND